MAQVPARDYSLVATYAFLCCWRLVLAKYTGLPSWRNTVPRPFKPTSVCRVIDFWFHIFMYRDIGNLFLDGIK